MEKVINIFGDSITWGANDEMGGWVSLLRNYLAEKSEDYFEVYNLGISGDSTDGLHQNSKGHEKMFLRVRDFLESNKII